MPSVQYLREFINERLTAAAEQIFLEFEKTIVQYEEEIDRQRRLLDITWKPEIKLHRTDVPQQHVCKEEEEEVLPEQQLWNQERSSSLDQEEPEPPQIKEEQQQLLLMEADAVTVNSVCGERDNRGPEPDIGQLLSPSSAGKPDQEAWRCLDSGCVDSSAVLETCYVPQQHVCKEEEEVLPEQQLWNQERSSSVDQEDQEEQGEQLVVGQQSDPFVVAATYTAHINCVNDSHVLERHCVTETGKKSVKCDVCGKAFQHRSRMIKHRRIHTGVKPYACNACGRRFYEIYFLKYHERIHTGVKPYACGERFVQSAMLKTHMRSHTGETLDCKTCGRCFSQKSHLLRHMKIHTREPKPA